jgi:hypothetical protein
VEVAHCAMARITYHSISLNNIFGMCLWINNLWNGNSAQSHWPTSQNISIKISTTTMANTCYEHETNLNKRTSKGREQTIWKVDLNLSLNMKLKNQKPKHVISSKKIIMNKGWIRPHLKAMLNKLKLMWGVQFLIICVLGPSLRKIS